MTDQSDEMPVGNMNEAGDDFPETDLMPGEDIAMSDNQETDTMPGEVTGQAEMDTSSDLNGHAMPNNGMEMPESSNMLFDTITSPGTKQSIALPGTWKLVLSRCE